MKALAFGVLFCFATTPLVWAAPIATAVPSALFIRVDWQEPPLLPPRLRNHCAYDSVSARPYCSDHCGFNYQVYSCSHQSFGCCRVGFGYCDWNGLLRCHP
jgi:hypothetical protein